MTNIDKGSNPLEGSGNRDRVREKGLNATKAIGPALALALAFAPVAALPLPAGAQAEESQVEAPAEPEEKPPTLVSPELAGVATAYRSAPSDASWKAYESALIALLRTPLAAKSAATQIIAANPSIKEFGATVHDAAGARVWDFPGNKDCRHILVQTGAGQVDAIDLPDGISLTGARLVQSVTTTVHKTRRGVKKIVKADGPRYLILAGYNNLSGLIWLKAFKPYQGSWYGTQDPFNQVPPYLLENVSGKASFSGSSLVLAVSSRPQTGDPPGPKPASGSYQIVLKLAGSSYVLAGTPQSSGPLQVVSYFVQCLRQGRLDLAKAWLKEPELISIPRYLGLVGKTPSQPYKLVAMAAPPGGAPRYRLVTYDKHDLIFDTTMVKKQWAIRGIFVAPPDPLAKQLSGTLVGAAPAPADEKQAAEDEAASTKAH